VCLRGSTLVEPFYHPTPPGMAMRRLSVMSPKERFDQARTPMLLQDQKVIVTGAGQGIGKAGALKLAAAGADIAAVDINPNTVVETAAAVQALGRHAVAITADLGSVAEIDRMVAETIKAFGRIDTLVNNAGVTRRAYIMDLTEEDWDKIHR